MTEAGYLSVVERNLDASDHAATRLHIEAQPDKRKVTLQADFNLPPEMEERYGPLLQELQTRVDARSWNLADMESVLGELLSVVPREDLWRAWCSHAADHYIERLTDAQALASWNGLSPIGLTPIEHVGSLALGHEDDADDTSSSSAALLSAVVQTFSLPADIPVERILTFRDKHAGSLGRLRSALADLGESLKSDGTPRELLGRASDTYANRVVPALGDLESVMKESKISFFIKSAVGASAVVLAPVEPIKAVEKGAELAAQSLNYSFSRDKLVREHPFGYLYRLGTELHAEPARATVELIESASSDPRASLTELFLRQEPGVLVQALLGGSHPLEFAMAQPPGEAQTP